MIKSVKDFSSFVISAGMVLVLCWISTSAYASSDDEPIVWINPPWPQDEPWYQPLIMDIKHMPTDDNGQIIIEYLLPPGKEILPYPPRFNGVPPIDIDGSLFDSYASPEVGIYPPDWPQPYPVLYPSLLPLEPSDIIGGDDPINLEDIDLDVKYVLLPERPRFNGVPPIDIDGSLFDSYRFSGSSSEPASSSITVVPEPATLLLLGFGGLVLRRKR